MELRIQLITFQGCPNASAARAAIERALAESGIAASVEEIDSSAPEAPGPLRDWGSPTVLVNGQDVGGESGPSGRSCRLYRGANGRMQGVPPEAALTEAIQRASTR